MNMLKTSPIGATEPSTGASPCVNGMYPPSSCKGGIKSSFALTGRCSWGNIYTQGDALGWVIIGLTGRLSNPAKLE